MITEYLTGFFLICGAIFSAIAALGVLRLQDTLSRLHAATKAGAFGGSCLLLAALIHFKSAFVIIEVLLIIIFFYLTTPIASHLLGRLIHRSYKKK